MEQDNLHVGGRQVDPAHLESIVLKNQSVTEAVMIGVPDDAGGTTIVCFARLKPDEKPRETLKEALRLLIERELGGHQFTPREIVFVRDLPHTQDDRTKRKIVRDVYSGSNNLDLSGLDNPAVVEELRRALQYSRVRQAITYFAESVLKESEKKPKTNKR